MGVAAFPCGGSELRKLSRIIHALIFLPLVVISLIVTF
jgi:hypothetical protein